LAVPVDRPKILETTALGAAWLAGSHAGVWPGMKEFSRKWALDRRFEPVMAEAERKRKVKGWRDAVRRTLSATCARRLRGQGGCSLFAAMPSLSKYRSKRDFSRTPEPSGAAAADAGNRFVVHKHHATADHYDLRLELGGVLKSWAVPKGPSLNPEDKRLAVETEDHPLAYIDFEGVTPAGQYGGGPMIVWDRGVWAPMDDPEKAIASGAFKFRLFGEKLKGGWMLTRLKPKQGETKRNWLLFKERDQAAEPDTDILAARPESVKTGRRIEELAAPRKQQEKRRAAPPKVGRLPGAVKAPFSTTWSPQLASVADAPPAADDWLHEIKFDGYRTLAFVADGKARLQTRSGLDWTSRYAA